MDEFHSNSLLRVVFLFHWVFLSTCSSSDAYGSLSGVEICERVGNYIYEHRMDEGGSTNQSFVLLNSPVHAFRLKEMERNFPIEAQEGRIQKFLNAKIDPVYSTKAIVRDRVFRDTADSFNFYGLEIKKMIQLLSPMGSAFVKALNISDYRYKKFYNYSGAQLLSEVWVEVLSNPNYRVPLLGLVQKLQNEIYMNRIIDENSIFEDLVEAFLQVRGLSETDAKTMAWNILGLYGSQGAVLGNFSIHYDFKKTGIGYALSYLSILISVVDSKRLSQQGRSYALPRGFQTSCAVGKPYHFWMSAYLAYQLSKYGYSGQKSMEAPFRLGEFYEYYFETNGRGKKEVKREEFLVQQKLDSIVLDSIRISHVLHAAGARFGAFSSVRDGTRPDWDLDEILVAARKNSKLAKLLKLHDMTGYYSPFLRYYNLQKMTASSSILSTFQQ